MIVWRIAAETRTYPAHDLSGTGAALAPGRWNDHQQPVVYCAASIELAMLETVVHIAGEAVPLNRFLVEVTIPDPVWAARKTYAPAELPVQWNAIPAGMASVNVGSAWIIGGQSAILGVPSVIVPEASVLLINPKHPDAGGISARVVRQIHYHRLVDVPRLPDPT